MSRQISISISDKENFTIELGIIKYDDYFSIYIPACEKEEMVIKEGSLKELANAFRHMASLLDGF